MIVAVVVASPSLGASPLRLLSRLTVSLYLSAEPGLPFSTDPKTGLQ
jgi:hypothetical protein